LSDAWKQFAALFLQEHPACERCEDAEQSTPATQVVPVIEDPALRWRGENLQALCDSCAGHYEEVSL
jgi:hypothetical protein